MSSITTCQYHQYHANVGAPLLSVVAAPVDPSTRSAADTSQASLLFLRYPASEIENSVVVRESVRVLIQRVNIQAKTPTSKSLIFSTQTVHDVVIIGSGHGSGVAASRFARAGKSVCVLERGAEKWPGEYPHTARDVLRNYEVTGHVFGKSHKIGRNAGLYRTVKGEGQDVFMGCGLGGTSLINAGVWLRPDERVLDSAEWPTEIKEKGLDEYYYCAERMFRPTPFPSTYSTPTKLSAVEAQARTVGIQDAFYRPPLTTSFNDGINRAGVHMRANTGSGNECSGVNDGSKNSVLVTYLADAWAWGAELFCGIDVKYVKRQENSAGHILFFTTDDAAKRQSWVIAVSFLNGLFNLLQVIHIDIPQG